MFNHDRQYYVLSRFIRIMKLTTFFLLITFISVNANVYSQVTRLDLKVQGTKIKNVLNRIEDQSNYFFMYNDRKVDVDRKVNIDLKQADIDELLEAIFAGTDTKYTIKDRQIVLYNEGDEGISNLAQGDQQSKTVTGRVTDSSGSPLPGVSIVIKGTTQGIITDADGKYLLSKVPADATLVFSFVGMKVQEISVSGKTIINVTMDEETIGLEEVVAIGYGTMKKSDLTGAVVSLKSEELMSSPISSVDQGLQGKTAGVQVFQSSGQPGSAPRIRIRGTNSINGGSQPLYVVDGFPFYNSDNNSGVLMSNAGFNPLSTINPNDIESIEVLKDASATAIYGSRASNGVILITTKKGKNGKPQISFDSYYGLQYMANKIDLLNAREYAIVQNECFERRNKDLRYTQADIDSLGVYGGTDWQDELYRSSVPIQNYNLTISGGNENTKYSLSAGYFTQDGLIINSGTERASFRVSLEQKINEKLSIGSDLSYSNTNTDLALTNTNGSGSGGVSFRALIEDPTKPVYTEDGEFNYDKASLFWGGNCVADATLLENKTITDRLLGNVFAEWKITPEITGKVVFGVDILNNEERQFVPSELYRSNSESSASLGKVKDFTWLNDYTLTFHKLFNEIHDVNFVLGSSFQSNNHNSLVGSTSDLVIEDLKYYSLSGGSDPAAPRSYFSEWSFASFFSRANYILKDKYLFTLTGRYDGSSRFGEGNKWGFFPSASFAWRLMDEEFIKSLNAFSNLKLRTGYGITGNSEIGLYKTQQTLSQAYYLLGNNTVIGYGPSSSNLANPDLGWESTSQVNIGLDIGFLNNRISSNIDYYYKTTTDLLLDASVPLSSGRTACQKNMGKITNEGIDFYLNTINIKKSNFKWTTSLNISHNKNRVKDLGGTDLIIFTSDVRGGWVNTYRANVLKVGQPLGVFYGYVTDGIVQLGEEGSVPTIEGKPDPQAGYFKFKDLDGDNTITSEDRTIIGNPNPDITGGITNTFSYKGFDLSFSLVGAFGFDIFSHTKAELLMGRGERNSHRDMLKAWSEDNPTNEFMINGIEDTQTLLFYRNPLSWYVEHVSYLRVQNVTLTYNLPKDFLSRLRLSGAKIYMSTNNLYTFTNYEYGYDPEVNSFGNSNTSLGQDYDTYPRPRSVLLGININF